ncbi:MAG: MucR family transcriptional regulator [Methylobacterium mesophilicum]|nr:MucR family transcriptional regulator [Methylobacterium mesophilicum]
MQHLKRTGRIVQAYVSHNYVRSQDLPFLIATVHAALTALRLGSPRPELKSKLVPPIDPKRTVFADRIISLETGRPMASLTKHLAVRGMTPEQYREKWGLPHDYPMVAANHSAQRSALAKRIGLGRTTHRRRSERRQASEA